ncbi:MAG TPA: glycogen synthase GlgA [Kofleriaceae bacterium]
MRVLHIASEVAPFAQSGGLADVVAGLSAAQAESHGLPAAVLVPLYRGVAAKLALDDGVPVALAFGAHRFDARIRTAQVGRVRYGFLDCAPLYDRAGTLYGPGGGADFDDNHVRFAALGAAAALAGDALLGGAPDVIHCHDWQAGYAAIAARAMTPKPLVVATIHNLAFRGLFPKAAMAELGIPWDLFTPDKLEFYDQLSFLKAGLALADAVTTVSPTYAREILTPERGEGLDGFLRWNVQRLVGIVNGIDAVAWDPATDAALPARFSRDDLAGKARCRAALAAELPLTLGPTDALAAVIARFADQKGIDLVADLVPDLAALGARLVVLGSGDPALESRFRYLAETFHEHVAVRIGFDHALSRRIYAGADLFLMPSRFEPCGLGQLYAMRYGTVPIVHAVGGLRDTVLDPYSASPFGDAARPGQAVPCEPGAGIRFEPDTVPALRAAVARGVALCRDPDALGKVRRLGMQRDSSWTASAQQYVQLYRSLR